MLSQSFVFVGFICLRIQGFMDYHNKLCSVKSFEANTFASVQVVITKKAFIAMSMKAELGSLLKARKKVFYDW